MQTIKINGIDRNVTNAFSYGPGCEPHEWEIDGRFTLRQYSFGWILSGAEASVSGQFIPELSIYGRRVEVSK